MNDLVVATQSRQLTAADVRAQVNLVQEVMKAVMKLDTHYGTIPGTKKPSLYKAGAEVLCATFRIADKYEVEDLSVDGMARFRVRCVGTHQTTGIVLGEGLGECSSYEEKYKWRAAVCDEEYDGTPENMRRIKYSKWNNKVEKKKQIRTESADQSNTILKMGCKRAKIGMTLNVTAASDIFTQDIEDLPEELRHNDEDENQAQEERTLENYSADAFKKNLPTWMNLIQTGKKTAAQIIATVSSKAILSDAQKKEIEAVVRQEAPAVSFAIVEERLQKAETEELLDLAADFIQSVADEKQRDELTAIYKTLKAKFAEK